jgi:hypothetical protein
MTRTAADVERDVEATRDHLDRTVEALKDKMTPGQLFDEASHALGGAGQQVWARMLEQARENPMPLAVMGLGLAWLMVSNSRGSAPSHNSMHESRSFAPVGRESSAYAVGSDGGGISETLKGVGEKAAGLVGTARESLSSAASTAGQAGSSAASSMGHAGEAAREQMRHAASAASHSAEHMARRARGTFSDLMDREPLIVGALGVLVGIAVGAAIPSTPVEDRLMGETRDDLMQRGKDLAQEGLQQASAAAQAAMEAVKEGIEQPADGDTPPADRAAEIVRNVVSAASEKLQPGSSDGGNGASTQGSQSQDGQSQGGGSQAQGGESQSGQSGTGYASPGPQTH